MAQKQGKEKTDNLPLLAPRRPPVVVLLIEDDPDDELLVRESLIETKGVKFIVEWEESLARGLQRLEGGGIDVVLLDLSLPDSSGTGTFRQVYTQAPGVPIVVLTGLEDEELGAELVKAGGQDYLVKGQVNGTLLTRCIKYAIERKQADEVIRRMAKENVVLAEIGRIMGSSLQIDEVYERFSQQVLKLIPFDNVSLSIVDLEQNSLKDAYIFGVNVPGRQQGKVSPLRGTYEEEIVRNKVGLIIQGLNLERIAERYPDLVASLRSGLQSHIAVPLISKDQVIGILQLRSARPNAYTKRELQLLERVGSQIAGAIANSQLYAQIVQTEMVQKYRELAGLSPQERSSKMQDMVRAEYDLSEEKLRPFAISRLQAWLKLDSEVAERIVSSYNEGIGQMAADILERRDALARTLSTDFSEEDGEHLIALDPGVFSTASPQVREGAPQPAKPAIRTRKWWWPFGKR